MRTRLVVLVALLVAAPAGAAVASFAPANAWRDRGPLNVAHRGGALEAPENTLFALEEAVEAGADMVEIDVRMARDGRLVVLHDPTLDRTTDRRGPVAARNVSELKGVDAAHWFVPGEGADHDAPKEDYVYRGIATGDVPPPAGYAPDDFTVPTLREVLQRIVDAFVYIEVKAETPDAFVVLERVHARVHEAGRVGDVVVASAHDGVAEASKARHPELDTARGWGRTATFWIGAHAADGTPRTGHEVLSAPHRLGGQRAVDAAFVQDAHARGLAVHAWTVNEGAAMRELLDLGVDGIITDRPSTLADVMAAG